MKSIRAHWQRSRERRDRLIARVLDLIYYHQANIAAAKASQTKQKRAIPKFRNRPQSIHLMKQPAL